MIGIVLVVISEEGRPMKLVGSHRARERDLVVDLLKWDSHSVDLVSCRASAEVPCFAVPPHRPSLTGSP